MLLTIELTGELEVALLEQASRAGLTADLVARRLLSDVLTSGLHRGDSTPPVTGRSGEEKAKDFVEWARSHRYTPPLSDE